MARRMIRVHETQDAEDSNLADYLLPDREELERVTPKIEQELESMWDVEEKVFRKLAIVLATLCESSRLGPRPSQLPYSPAFFPACPVPQPFRTATQLPASLRLCHVL